MIRVVLDTNALVSCLLFGGTPGELLNLWKTERIRLLMCRAMVDEFLRVLAYPKFNLSEGEIQYLLYEEVLPHAEMVEVRPGPVLITEDPPMTCSCPGPTPAAPNTSSAATATCSARKPTAESRSFLQPTTSPA